MAVGDVEKMIAVGLVWGATNALMRKGVLIWNRAVKSFSASKHSLSQSQRNLPIHRRIVLLLNSYLKLILTWQYSVPLFLNLAASATFFTILGHTPISLAVPVTNATTFCATAVMGMLLGEDTRVGYALLGTFFIVLGVWLCVL
ncbi:hypothetical protein Nepgr_005158 [Nepenthes gracilis]|uniref:Transmembrane protein 234 homolog n=1 Tax=Nepenthes gracilis TaxID=150966 RepID=A0AAD3S2M2_NEPGR|nr:hypothetical protein Nepgr_005158 [Nepenthes gracilis]